MKIILLFISFIFTANVYAVPPCYLSINNPTYYSAVFLHLKKIEKTLEELPIAGASPNECFYNASFTRNDNLLVLKINGKKFNDSVTIKYEDTESYLTSVVTLFKKYEKDICEDYTYIKLCAPKIDVELGDVIMYTFDNKVLASNDVVFNKTPMIFNVRSYENIYFYAINYVTSTKNSTDYANFFLVERDYIEKYQERFYPSDRQFGKWSFDNTTTYEHIICIFSKEPLRMNELENVMKNPYIKYPFRVKKYDFYHNGSVMDPYYVEIEKSYNNDLQETPRSIATNNVFGNSRKIEYVLPKLDPSKCKDGSLKNRPSDYRCWDNKYLLPDEKKGK